ncbi:hypothetical protein ACFYQA_22755 [Streptomyces sp. NPDC005774]|uniref:hypothetical protein n=1 Tax=Streptomyces sp. NPDC005774 TaxID=3364728 RepID=UPI0036C5CAB4
MSREIRERTTKLRDMVAEVQKVAKHHDPGTPEWRVLVGLAAQVDDLLAELPWELQPVPTTDELIDLIGL